MFSGIIWVFRLPVPAELLKSKNDNEVMDESSLHDGRIRSFPHERGNWATYVYIPCMFAINFYALY